MADYDKETFVNGSDEHRRYYEAAIEAHKIVNALISGEDWDKQWKHEKAHGNDKFYTTHLKDYGRIFCCKSLLDVSDLDTLYQELYANITEHPKWNPDIVEFEQILQIGNQTDVVYSASHDLFGGLIKSREFIDARSWRKKDGAYYMSQKVIPWPHPEKHKRVRGEDIFSLVRIRKVGTSQIEMVWVMKFDLKGLLPKSLVERAMFHLQSTYMHHIRERMNKVLSSQS